MANLGISNASYYTDRFIHKLNKEVDNSVSRLSTAQENITAKDIASLKSMDYTFRLDVAATNAAVKSMSITQSYLSTAITSLDNASAILARIHELAVQGSNSTNTENDRLALTAEAEALADEFHKSMSSADFKGKLVFDSDVDNQTGIMALGKESAGKLDFGIGEIDYDFFYDYKNPSTDRYNTGSTYEITSELSDEEKASLLSRLPDASEEDLIIGFQFVAEAQEKVGEGLEVADLTYNRAQGTVQFDSLASFTREDGFNGQYLDFQISENAEIADNLTIEDTDNIQVLAVGDGGNPNDSALIQFFDQIQNKWIDIGLLDEDLDGTNGAVLRVHMTGDATVPGTSAIQNGDFENTSNVVVDVIMDPVYGPQLDADGNQVQTPRMETVEVLKWDDDAETIPTMVQDTETVTRQVEIGGVLQFDNAPDVIVGYNPRDITEVRPDNWYYFEDNVDFGSNFTVYESYIADRVNGGVSADPTTAVSVPTPTEQQMVKPAYDVYEDTTVNPLDGSEIQIRREPDPSVKNHDNNPINSLDSGGNDLDISLVSNGGDNDLDLDTGFVELSQGFGIFHGPAAVSAEFTAQQGDFLKFDYDARIVNDDFHVAGYIYNVATNEITMALNSTDSYGAGTASIEVSETANYRFVFAVGTYDLTGGKEAGSNMKIDNIRAEDPYDIEQNAVSELLQALHYSNLSETAASTKVLSTSLNDTDTDEVIVSDLAQINITGVDGQPDGPFKKLGDLNLVTLPEDAIIENDANILTTKVEAVQEEINMARVRATSQFNAISSAIESSTDLKSQFSLGSGTLTNLNFSSESAYLARRQIQHDIATAMLAQANLGQTHLIALLTQ